MGAIVVAYIAILDSNREPIQCKSQSEAPGAVLVLRSLDTSSKQINASFIPSNYNPAEDTIEINSVTPGSISNVTNFQPLLKIKPNPSSEAIPTATASAVKSNKTLSHFTLPYTSRSLEYPFEDYILNIQVDLRGKNDTEKPLSVLVVNEIDEAIILKDCGPGYSFDNNSPDLNSFNFLLKRHRFLRAMAIILYLVASIFLIYIATLEETAKVMANCLGYIAALWGIRSIIIGSAKLFPTMIDFLTLALYLLVVIIIFYKWLFTQNTQRKA
jgi:hypothetical protein